MITLTATGFLLFAKCLVFFFAFGIVMIVLTGGTLYEWIQEKTKWGLK